MVPVISLLVLLDNVDLCQGKRRLEKNAVTNMIWINKVQNQTKILLINGILSVTSAYLFELFLRGRIDFSDGSEGVPGRTFRSS
jgi:hypothetical protein